ncbi:PKD domain-containing protein [Haladaptatus sp. NG-SE-30]
MIRRLYSDSTDLLGVLQTLFLVGVVLVAALGPAVARVPTELSTTSTVSGTVLGPDGDPLVGDSIWLFAYDTYRPATTDETGSFVLSGNGTIAFYQRVNDHYWERDGVTDMHTIGQISKNNGDVSIPAGHVIDVRVLDASGDPVPNANVTVVHRSPTGATTAAATAMFRTDATGRVVPGGTSGLELTGWIDIQVQPPDSTRFSGGEAHTLIVREPTDVTISLSEAPPEIERVAAPSTAELGNSISLDVNASGAITEFRWDFDGDGVTDVTTTEPNVTHSYRDTGTFAPIVTAIDDDGTTATADATVSVVDTQAPVAALSGPATTAIDVPATFDAGESTDAGDVVRYVWEFGDGTTAQTETPTISHTFESLGSYAVRLTAYDEAGNADSATTEVSATEPPSIRAASDHWFVNESEATLDYDVANANGTSVEYAVDDGAWQPATCSPTVTGLTFGDHSVAFRLVHETGPLSHESAFDTATLTVDTEPPELSVSTTRVDVRPGTPLRVTVSDIAISAVSYRTNRSESGDLEVADTRDSISDEIDTEGWPAALTEVVVTARDRAGNTRSERVVFDLAPDLDIRSFQPANGTRVSNVVVSAAFARGNATLFVDGDPLASEVSGTSIEAPLPDLESGTHTARLVVTAAGHEVSATRTFELVASGSAENENGTGGGSSGAGGGGGGGFSEPIVDVMAGDDGVAIDLLNGRDGVTAWADLGETSAGSVRFSRFGVTFDRNDASTALTLDARTPTEDSPPESLAVFHVKKRYVRTGDVESATLRFSVASSALPADATLSDVVLTQRRDGDWRRLPLSRDGRNFTATVHDLSTVVVGVEGDDANTSESDDGESSSDDDEGSSDGSGSDGSRATTASERGNETNVESRTSTEITTTIPTDRVTATPNTQTVRSDGQPGFGFVASFVGVAVLVLFARKWQRL